MGESRAKVRNAADAEQVQRAAQSEERTRDEQLERVRAVMGHYKGRAFVWDLLSMAGVYRSIWEPSARIHYLAGRQDFGHELMAQVLEADEELYDKMATEARARARREAAATAAAHTPSAADTEEDLNG